MFLQQALKWLRNILAYIVLPILVTVLAEGPTPQHVAFIMDGNRRYARNLQKKIQDGHLEGFLALRKMLEICVGLDIKCVSAYAFAIENFKRSIEEVDALMSLLEEKLIELCQPGGLFDQNGVRLQVLGKTELLPESVRMAVRDAEDMTRHNTRLLFNLCMPYASRDEMTTAVQACVRNAITSGPNRTSMITEDEINHHLLTSRSGSPPLDILIRTGGDRRLSDFLLWQCCENTQLHFIEPYWPTFGLFDFIPIVLDYQLKVWRGWQPRMAQ
ncbi:Decaprenyl diphosphate synthase-like protein [Lyophyllum atratum]|nr:Decaprenyl diphosphate synthase-like protein [Lyophyllum atratum]